MKLLLEDKGQSMVEYGLLIAILSILTISSIALLGSNISNSISSIGDTLGNEEVEEGIMEDEVEKSRIFSFKFLYKEEDVLLDFSKEDNENTKSIFGFNFGTKDDLQQQIGEDLSIPDKDGEVIFNYDETNNTLTGSVNGSKMDEGSKVGSAIKSLFKFIINLFGF